MSREFGICGEIVVSCGASGSGAGLYLPAYQTITSAALYMKTAKGTTAVANTAGFWTAIDLSHTAAGYESVKLAAAANTTEQEIVNISGAGVLTHVISPSLASSGTMTIRVTADGTVHTFVSTTMGTQGRLCLGYIIGAEGEASASNGAGVSSENDAGFSITADRAFLPTPIQALSLGALGIVFESTLIVSIQGSANITATAEWLNSCANYTLGIPAGLV